ncbi:MAG: 50S ribosomal protein L30 [Deltaproteobacteria bacterium]|nr:50S ribosomal protein L30 [Deltaproteobacteria bacterium]
MLKVTLKKSVIKASKAQRETIRGLGLKRLNSSRFLGDTPAVRGMIRKVNHLVELEETED